MTIETLTDLFEHTLKDIYYAEKQVRKALPTLAARADDEALTEAFDWHLKETDGKIGRLESAFAHLGKPAAGETCPAIDGIIDETHELIGEVTDADTLDAALIAAAQAIAHYGITRYGTLCVWTEELGHADIRNLLEESLSHEKDFDSSLSHLAEKRLNAEAKKAA